MSMGAHIQDEKGNSIFVEESAGWIVAYDIQHAIDLIDANPIGVPVSVAFLPCVRIVGGRAAPGKDQTL